MPLTLRQSPAASSPRGKGNNAPVRALLLCIMMATTSPCVARDKAPTPTAQSRDVGAPPIALLFGMAVLGLFLGRRQ